MIYSFPSRGKTMQIDLNDISPAEMDMIRRGASGPSRIPTKDGRVIEINNNLFDEETLFLLRNSLKKDHLHPMDYDAPLFKGGFSERVHELVNPGERGSLYDAGARAVGGLVSAIREPARKLDIALARSPEKKEEKRQQYVDWKRSEEEYFQRHGGRDVYSGLGSAAPDVAMIVAGAGTGKLMMSALRNAGLVGLEKAAAERLARGVAEKEVKDWVVGQITKDVTARQIAKTAGEAVLKNIPSDVARKTMAGQAVKWGAETAAGEFATGATYGALKSGGDPKEALKEGATFAAFTPVAGAVGAAMVRKELGGAVKGPVSEYWNKLNERVGQLLYSQIGPIQKYSRGVYDQAVLNLGVKGKAHQIAREEMESAFAPIIGIKERVPWTSGDAEIVKVVSDVAKARRAMEINRLGKNPGKFFSSGEAEGVLKRYEELAAKRPDVAGPVEETIKGLQRANDRLLKYWLDNGVINRDMFEVISKSSEFYMPYHRVFNKAEMKRMMAEGHPEAAKSLKKLVGSEREAHDVVENIVLNYQNMIPSVDRHVLLRNLVDVLPEESKTFIQMVKTPLAYKLKTFDKDGVSNAAKQFFVPRMERKANEVMFMRDGTWEHWRIDDKVIADAINHVYHPNAYVKALQVMKNVKRIGITANPLFMARNASRDFLTSIMNDGALVRNPSTDGLMATLSDSVTMWPKVAKRALVDFPLAAAEVIAGSTNNQAVKKALARAGFSGEFFKELQKAGAGGSEMRETGRKGAKELIRQAAQIKTPLVEYINPKALLKPVEWMESVGRIIEQTPRLEEAHRIYSKTGNINEAAQAYRKITADFGEQGIISKGPLGQTVPFFSAQFAGMKSEFDAMKANPVGSMIKTIELVLVPTVYYWLTHHDKDDYRGRDTMDKNMYYYLTPTLRIPKGYGMYAMMGNIIERGLDRAFTDDPEATKGLWEALKLWAPQLSLPPAAGAVVGVWADKDPFFKSKIDPMYSENIPARDREKPSTTELAKVLGRPFKNKEDSLSPPKIDFVIKELGGGLASKAAQGISWGMTAGEGRIKPSTGAEKVPFVEAFATRPSDESPYSGEVRRFYESYGKTDYAYHSIKKAWESGDKDEYNRLINDADLYRDAVAYERLKGIRRYLSEGNKAYRLVADSKFTGNDQTGPMTPESKRALLTEISKKMNAAAVEGNRIYLDSTK